MEGVGSQMRSKYLSEIGGGHSLPLREISRGYSPSPSAPAPTSQSSQVARLEATNEQLSLENARLREELRRVPSIEDINDLSRGNRLLTQENEALSRKYQTLLDVHNRLLLTIPNGASSSDSLSKKAEARVQALKECTPNKWEDFSELSGVYENNLRKINEIYMNVKLRARDTGYQQDEASKWRTIAADIQESLDDIMQITHIQAELHSKTTIEQQVKNRELQRLINPKHVSLNATTPLQKTVQFPANDDTIKQENDKAVANAAAAAVAAPAVKKSTKPTTTTSDAYGKTVKKPTIPVASAFKRPATATTYTTFTSKRTTKPLTTLSSGRKVQKLLGASALPS